MGALQRLAVERLIAKATELGVPTPGPLSAFVCGSGSTYAARAYAAAHPELIDADGMVIAEAICCAEVGYTGSLEECSCWTPIWEPAEQAPPRPPESAAELQAQPSMCGDCAFRPGSPERETEYEEEALLSLPESGTPFWCHAGYDVSTRVGAWILSRLMQSLSGAASECSTSPSWASVSFTLGAGIRKAMDELAAAAESSSSTELPTRLLTAPSRPVWSSCTDATSPPASSSDISDAEACLRTTLIWLRRGGLSDATASTILDVGSPTNRLLRSVADALLAKRCVPSLPSSGSATPTSADSPDRCDALFDGMRRPARWVHPTRGEIEGDPGDWQPPQIGGIPYRADGSPGLLCAGWLALRIKAVAR